MEHEAVIRLGSYAGIFATMALLELAYPRRRLRSSKAARWINNVAVTFLDTALVRLLLPLTGVTAAAVAAGRGWGILPHLPLHPVAAVIAAVILLDLLIWAQHVVFHMVPPLWRLHMMHHADLDIDVTTGARFHPLEIFLSMGIKIAAVIALGAPPWSVLAFEVILNGTAMFNHSNVRLHPLLDGALRLFVVTPDMHRVHHSVVIREMNSNYGFNLSVWDRLFGTYRAQPGAGHTEMAIGLANFRDARRLTLPYMLAMPFGKRVR